MRATYSIHSDPDSPFFEMVLSGLFDVATGARLAADRDAALLALRCEPHSHYTLLDVSGCMIQPRDTADLFARIIANPPRRSRRMAMVVGSALARMQVDRLVAGRSEVALFDRRVDALAWLRAEGATIPAACAFRPSPSRAAA